jgi:hypothetical protein
MQHLPTLRLPRVLRDFVVGMALFGLIAAAAGSFSKDHKRTALFSGAAFAGHYVIPMDGTLLVPATYTPTSPVQSTRVARAPEQSQSLIILGLVFSSMVAFNLAFLRHLRRVYASPRQGAWRRS